MVADILHFSKAEDTLSTLVSRQAVKICLRLKMHVQSSSGFYNGYDRVEQPLFSKDDIRGNASGPKVAVTRVIGREQ